MTGDRGFGEDKFLLTTGHLVLEIAKALVDKPENVRVDAVCDDICVTLRLRVAAEDLGKVIGREGRTARSIRTILLAASSVAQKKVALDIQTD